MWILLSLLLAVVVVIADEQSSCAGGVISYKMNGASTSGYLIRTPGSGSITASGSSITVSAGPRFFMTQSCQSSFGSGGGVFSSVKLIGGSISFTVDVSKLGCGTNAAFYLVSMPGGSATSTTDFYCDANCVGGQCCPEMDLFEANRHALQVTPHSCSSATAGCDGGGCAKNFMKDISNGYGAGTGFKINTDNPYTVKVSFSGSGSTLNSITTTLTQGSNSISLTHDSGCGSNLSGMGKRLSNGMVPVWSYWTGGMMWLDQGPCSSDNPEVKGNWVFSDLQITGSIGTASGPTPPPPPPPGSVICGTKGMNNNNYWLEFTVSSSVVSNPAGTTAKVSCSGTTYTCSWFASGKKYQCSLTAGCASPSVTVGSKACALDSTVAYATSDMTATTNVSSEQPLIIGLSAGLAVAVIVIVVLIVFVLKKNSNYIETA
jgi:hypothetical protein